MQLPGRLLKPGRDPARRAGSGAVPAAAAVKTGTLRYIKMGDSYSAGAGIVPPGPNSPPVCPQSTLNWARDLATARDYQLTDVSCSGAEKAMATIPQQYSGSTDPPAPIWAPGAEKNAQMVLTRDPASAARLTRIR